MRLHAFRYQNLANEGPNGEKRKTNQGVRQVNRHSQGNLAEKPWGPPPFTNSVFLENSKFIDR